MLLDKYLCFLTERFKYYPEMIAARKNWVYKKIQVGSFNINQNANTKF
jgi:hypothetical protein